MAWDTIYEPSKDRVVSPVSRVWSCASGGFALFCWDNYFAGCLAGLDCREIAYSNVVEIARERRPAGFCTEDRSQPPVGSWVMRELYRRYGERWLLEVVFEDILAWNRWRPAHRDTDGLLCWGSETDGVGARYGAALESGLDNSPMYDEVPFDAERSQLRQADVGLLGLYLMDCRALADPARVLGRGSEEEELRLRVGTQGLRRQVGRAPPQGMDAGGASYKSGTDARPFLNASPPRIPRPSCHRARRT